MKRKLLALLLSAAMLLAICLPALCAAAESDVVSSLEENAESGTVSSLEENAESGTAPDTSELYTQLLATESIAEVEAIISGMEESELEASLSALDQEQLNALQAHLDALAQAEYIPPQTVVFTEAGPFLPAVNVSSARRWLRTSSFSARQTDNALILNKTAEYDATSNSVKIRLEAYTTGTVTTTTTTVPVDIVLVLDQSGSMADNFDDNDSRQSAMKKAVNNFIDAVAAKYSADADHRMAIVTFGSGATTLQGWTTVNPAGQSTLKGKINGLPNSPSGATRVDEGMKRAVTLMGSGYNYTGANTQRQKVVIVFTDGVPTTNTDFDTDVATNAIASAKNLKDGGATVYTIGIFGNANPSQLHDSSVDGNVGDKWQGLKILFWGDVSQVSVPAANRFLNYVSSNFRDADEIGLKRESWNIVLAAHESFEITKNFDRTDTGYYLTASDSTSLNTIFQTISNQIQTADIDLGSETVIKDVLAPQFVMPAAESAINLFTADAKADGTFDTAQRANGVTAAISGDTVSVTGFDFNENFVSETAKSDGSYGKKLIIEFTAPVREGFFGGNNVQTNGAASGVYVNGEANQPLEAFPIPEVNIPLNVPNFAAVDANIYLLGTAPKADKLCDLSVYDNAEAWQKAYVNFGTPSITAGTVSNTADSQVTVSLTVAPTKDGFGAKGKPATAVTKNANANANVFVFKPVLTFEDSEIYLGETANYLGQNKKSEQWMHGQTLDTDVTMMGARPTLGRTYNPVEGAFAEETDVSVTTAINGTDVTSYTTFINAEDSATDHQFTVKVKTCTLTIEKSGAQAVDGGQTFLFHIEGAGNNKAEQVNLNVVVSGNGSAVICGLPIGTYRVTEDEGWSWRYKAQTDPQQVVELKPNKDEDAATLNFVNDRVAEYWLDGNAYAENAFSAVSQ